MEGMVIGQRQHENSDDWRSFVEFVCLFGVDGALDWEEVDSATELNRADGTRVERHSSDAAEPGRAWRSSSASAADRQVLPAELGPTQPEEEVLPLSRYNHWRTEF